VFQQVFGKQTVLKRIKTGSKPAMKKKIFETSNKSPGLLPTTQKPTASF
jgi:hypothetical protein